MFSTCSVLLPLELVKKLHLDFLEVDLSQWHDKSLLLCDLWVHLEYTLEEAKQELVNFLQVSLMIELFYFQGSCFSYTGKLVGVVQ